MKVHRGYLVILCGVAIAASACDPGVWPLVATTMAASSDVSQSATVGNSVSDPPSVKVLDQDENPIADVEVTWAVTAGGGTIQKATDTTDEDGVASAGRWTLGTTAGANSLRASVAVATDATPIPPVVFNATGRSGAAAAIVIVAGNNQTAATGLQLLVSPSVRVSDQFGNPNSNVAVTFQIVQGGGQVVAATQTTGQNGIATVGAWTMGATAGQNKLNATVNNLGFVQFVANATAAPQCLVHTPFTFPGTGAGTLESADCVLPGGQFIDFFDFVNPLTQALKFEQQSTAFAPYVQLFDISGNPIAEDLTTVGATAVTSSVTIIAPAANMVLGPSSFASAKLGDYTLTSSVVSGLAENCKAVFVMRGIATNQTLAATDCVDTTGPYYVDRFYVHLVAGQAFTVKMASTVFDAFLELDRVNGASLVSVATNNNESQTSTNSSITFTPQQTGYYLIVASSNSTSAVGAYTLTINP